MRILNEMKMDPNFSKLNIAEHDLEIWVDKAVAKGLLSMVRELLDHTQDTQVTAEDILNTKEGRELKLEIKVKLMELFGQE